MLDTEVGRGADGVIYTGAGVQDRTRAEVRVCLALVLAIRASKGLAVEQCGARAHLMTVRA